MSWYGSETEPSDTPPEWWLRLLDSISSSTLFQEVAQSADSVCTLDESNVSGMPLTAPLTYSYTSSE